MVLTFPLVIKQIRAGTLYTGSGTVECDCPFVICEIVFGFQVFPDGTSIAWVRMPDGHHMSYDSSQPGLTRRKGEIILLLALSCVLNYVAEKYFLKKGKLCDGDQVDLTDSPVCYTPDERVEYLAPEVALACTPNPPGGSS